MIFKFVVSFVLGIIFERLVGLGWSIGVLIFLVTVVLFFYFRSGESSPISPKIIFVVGLGFCLGIIRINLVDVSPDLQLSQSVGQKISFKAVVVEEPDPRDTTTRYTTRPYFSSAQDSGCADMFLLENSPCSPQSGSQATQNPAPSKSLILLIADRFPKFQYGDKISVSGRLDLPKNFITDNKTEFDYISYLSKDRIHFLIYHPRIEKLENDISINSGRSIIAFLYSLKNNFIKNIAAVVPEPNSSLLGGLIFGAKQSLGEKLLENFRSVGLIHIIVLSGYNITIIAVGIFYLTGFLNRRKLGFILSVIFIILFALMVGLGATVIRACIMALIAILARYLGRPSDALRWLFIAGFLMLLWNPLILFYDPSFQLSFMATLGLILFSPLVESFIAKNKVGRFIPAKFGLREIVSSTLAVQFFVLPLLIRMSGFVSLISFLINPIVLPLVPWAMGFGALTGAVGLIPLVGQIFSWPLGIVAYLISQIIIYLTEFSAQIPFATLQTGAIPLWLIFIWYVFYGSIYWKLRRAPSRST